MYDSKIYGLTGASVPVITGPQGNQSQSIIVMFPKIVNCRKLACDLHGNQSFHVDLHYVDQACQ